MFPIEREALNLVLGVGFWLRVRAESYPEDG